MPDDPQTIPAVPHGVDDLRTSHSDDETRRVPDDPSEAPESGDRKATG
jgi:hypothetical protein